MNSFSKLAERFKKASIGQQSFMVCIVFWLLFQKSGELAIELKRSVSSKQVLGASVIELNASSLETNETYYLADDFKPVAPPKSDVDDGLFVKAKPVEKIVVEKRPERPKPRVAKIVKESIEEFVYATLTLNGVSQEGAFINGGFYLWGEEISDYPVVTSEGTYTGKVKLRGGNVVVSINDKNVILNTGAKKV